MLRLFAFFGIILAIIGHWFYKNGTFSAVEASQFWLALMIVIGLPALIIGFIIWIARG